MGMADITAFHMLHCVCLPAGNAHKTAIGAYGFVVNRVGPYTFAAARCSTNDTGNLAVIASHGITKFTFKRAFVIFFSAVNNTFNIFAFFAPVAAAHRANPCV